MRLLFVLIAVLALGVMGCSETTGTGGSGGIAGNGGDGGGAAGNGGDGGGGGTLVAGCDLGFCTEVDCDDDDPCTKDVCNRVDGSCSYLPTCDDFNDCTTEACDPTDESCSTPTPVADGTSCAGGTCQSGVCVLSGTVLPCTEQGIRNAIAAGDGTYTFDCDGTAPVLTQAQIVIDNDVILDGEGKLTVDGKCEHRVFDVPEGTTAELRGLVVTNGLAVSGSCVGNVGDLTVTSSTLSRCTAEPGPLASILGSGAIDNRGTMTLADSVVVENDGPRGAIGNYGDSMTLLRTTVSRNGTIGIFSEGPLMVIESTISDNGSGIMADGASSLTVVNSTVSGNNFDEEGFDGIGTSDGRLRLLFSTVVGNVVGSGLLDTTGTVIVGACERSIGVSSEQGHNIESPGDTCGFVPNSDPPGDRPNVTPEELALGPLADNGGPTETHALGEGSVAIDSMPEEGCGVPGDPDIPLTTDQRGEPRDDGLCDIGAFEVQPGDSP